MGLFDTYGRTQLKAGAPMCRQYTVGDTVEIPDGVYVDDDTLIVVSGGKFIAELDNLYDYFGDEIDKAAIAR
jgi:hypothetical protein